MCGSRNWYVRGHENGERRAQDGDTVLRSPQRIVKHRVGDFRWSLAFLMRFRMGDLAEYGSYHLGITPFL